MVKKRKTKKFRTLRRVLWTVGLFALGIFTITTFAKVWGFMMANANTILWVTGGIIVGLILIGILSPKKVKKALFGSIWRFKA